jgi:hypothetical protein
VYKIYYIYSIIDIVYFIKDDNNVNSHGYVSLGSSSDLTYSGVLKLINNSSLSPLEVLKLDIRSVVVYVTCLNFMFILIIEIAFKLYFKKKC